MAGVVVNPNYVAPAPAAADADSGPSAEEVAALVGPAVQAVVSGLAEDVETIAVYDLTVAVRAAIGDGLPPDAYDGATIERAAADLGYLLR